MEHISIRTSQRNQLVNITSQVQEAVRESGVEDGLVCVFCPHTTAAITINENADPDVVSDILGYMSKLIPRNSGFDHVEGNSDSHIKSSLVAPSLTVIIEGGRLQLGTWQGIYFAEFDGPRTRRIWVKIIKG